MNCCLEGWGRLKRQVPFKNARRQLGDSNPCGQSPMDFESISLAARTQCHVMDHFLIGLIKQSLKCSGLLGSVNCKPLAALSLNFVLSLALPTCRRDATFRKSAASEDRTHDLRIMRPTRCQLRYRRCSYLEIALRQHAPAVSTCKGQSELPQPIAFNCPTRCHER